MTAWARKEQHAVPCSTRLSMMISSPEQVRLLGVLQVPRSVWLVYSIFLGVMRLLMLVAAVSSLVKISTEDDLTELLVQISSEVSVTKFGKFAFAYFNEAESAHQAISRLNHHEMKGKEIKIQLATKTEHDNPANFNYLSSECEMC